MSKNIFIHLQVQEGEYRHDHKVLHTTKCKNLDFAVEWYVAHFWGYGERQFLDDWWWWGEHAGRLVGWEEVPDDEYEILKKYL